MAGLRLAAPAKLNLFLHVTGRRADGYHELQTVFQLLDLCDTVTLAARDDGAVRRLAGAPGVADEDDLAVRAARALKRETGCPLGVDLGVQKRIPVGRGLGGGSSDAAAVLVGLERLWDLDLGADALAGIGLALGADVPVFVRGRSAWAEGVGERLVPVALEEAWYVVVDPACPVATGQVFGAADLTRNTPVTTMSDLLGGGLASGRPVAPAALMAHTANDCETVVRRGFPQVDEALRWLSRFGAARMTGTGSCVFSVAQDQSTARALAARVPGPWRGFAARGVNRSPAAGAA